MRMGQLMLKRACALRPSGQQRPLRRIAARRPNYCRLGGGKLGFCLYFRCHS
jgi:hypothetical protein